MFRLAYRAVGIARSWAEVFVFAPTIAEAPRLRQKQSKDIEAVLELATAYAGAILDCPGLLLNGNPSHAFSVRLCRGLR